MHFTVIFRILGTILRYFSFILAIPLLIGIISEFVPTVYPQPQSSLAFFLTILVAGSLSFLFQTLGKRSTGILSRRESILLVCLLWFVIAGISSLPFIFSGVLQNPLDAYFEAMSSLTTTGASILYPKSFDPVTGQELAITLADPLNPLAKYTFFGTIEPLRDPQTGAIINCGTAALGTAMLFWRCFMQWIGGLGIVVMFLLVLPALSIGGKFLFETEMSGHSKEPIAPRIKETASILWKIYIFLTALLVVLLIVTDPGISFFEAITTSFSTISTGGLPICDGGLYPHYQPSTLIVIALFMIGGSINFSLYFHLIKGRLYRLYNSELGWFLFSILIGCLLMSAILWKLPATHAASPTFSFKESLLYGSFQAISAQTSTGYQILIYDNWPFAAQALMIILVFIGGMAGSTCGGLKITRCITALKLTAYRIRSFFHPSEVISLKIQHKEATEGIGMNVLAFFAIVALCVLLGSFILILDGVDPMTSLATTSCMLNNSGLAFGGIGSANSVAFLSPLAKFFSILWMAMGRLEFFSLIMLAVPSFWRTR